jgi:hypothetical protein
MNADFVADYLADYKYLFYLFCLAVLVYRYITVGRKYPLFRKHQQSLSTQQRRRILFQMMTGECVIVISLTCVLTSTITT